MMPWPAEALPLRFGISLGQLKTSDNTDTIYYKYSFSKIYELQLAFA